VVTGTAATATEQIERANATGRTRVVFIHGLWLLGSSWDRWARVFEDAGYAAVAPGWPDDPTTVAEAKAHPEVFAHKTVGQVADHYAGLIGRLKKKPAVIGHSFGGLLAQIMAGRGLSAATVAIDRAPPRRPAAAVVGPEVGRARPWQPSQLESRGPADLCTVPLRVRECGQ